MLSIRIVAFVALLPLPSSVLAQEWTEYVDRTERFSINFPGQPTISEATYPPQRGAPVRARVFTVQAWSDWVLRDRREPVEHRPTLGCEGFGVMGGVELS